MDEIIKRLLALADEALVAGLPGTARAITDAADHIRVARQTAAGAAAVMLRNASRAIDGLAVDVAHHRMRLFERAAEACTGAAPARPAKLALPGGREVDVSTLTDVEVDRFAGVTDDEELEDLAHAEASADPVARAAQTSAASAAYTRRFLSAFARLYAEKRGSIWKVPP